MSEIRRSIYGEEGKEVYTLQLQKKTPLWWLLLLLLPFLLVVPIKKNISLHVLDTSSNTSIIGDTINFKYSKRDFFSFDSLTFFCNTYQSDSRFRSATDSNGIVHFQTEYQIYQYLSFWNRENDTAVGTLDNSICYSADSTYEYFSMDASEPNFLYSNKRYKNICLTILDQHDSEPLPGVNIYCHDTSNNVLVDSAYTDVSGTVNFRAELCSTVKLSASKYGWHENTLTVDVFEHSGICDTMVLERHLTIVKFIVKNKVNNRLIAGAHGRLYLETDPSIQVGDDAITNVNGVAKGVGEFDNVQVINSIKIDVNKGTELHHYNDTSTFENLGWIPVLKWNAKSDDNKVVYLTPRYYNLDIVLCIDATGSMDDIISTVKYRSKNFYTDLKAEMKRFDKFTDNIRIRSIAYSDKCSIGGLIESPFCRIPSQINEFKSQISRIEASGDAETALEALSLAIHSDFTFRSHNSRQIIVLITDDNAEYDLTESDCISSYNGRIENSYIDLFHKWRTVNANARLVLMANRVGWWTKINREWPNVIPVWNNGSVNNRDYNVALSEIAKAI